MTKGRIEELIAATQQERLRLDDPKNRNRYFIFGKIKESATRDGYSASFENFPDRVRRDAAWGSKEGTPAVFKVGDIFLSGVLKLSKDGLDIFIPLDELRKWSVDTRSLSETTEIGLDYVMDSRDLLDQLRMFLEAKKHVNNPFIGALSEPMPPSPIITNIKPRLSFDLNESQLAAIEKALTQGLTFYWGPPGTGKTKTMGAFAAEVARSGKRVLLTAMSNTALDQLLLATLERLAPAVHQTSIARLGRTMDDRVRAFSREAFAAREFSARRAGLKWSEHVRNSSIVAANFAFLTFPRAPNPDMFDFVLADEVSMANIPSIAAATYFAKIGVVFGGDPEQLPPVYPEDAEVPNEWFRANVYEKAQVVDFRDPRVAFLDTQYRMQREIGELVSEMFYEGKLKTGTKSLPMFHTFESRVLFVNCRGEVQTIQDQYFETEDQRRFNQIHAETVAAAALKAVKAKVGPPEIGIIAPYNAQMVKIREILYKSHHRGMPPLSDTKVSTVHSFQGQERKAIILDFTDDNIKPSTLTAKRQLVNVALSRAKELLIIVGNRDYLINEKYFSSDEMDMFKRMLRRTTALSL